MALVLGIDPGQDGALVWLFDGVPYRREVMPATPKVGIDIVAFIALLEADRPQRVVLERAQAMPRQGVASSFKYGRDYGAMLGVLQCMQLSHTTVHPSVWHRALCGGKPSGEPQDQAKARTLRVVQQQLPTLDLLATPRSRVPHAGIVDAAAIALWGSR